MDYGAVTVGVTGVDGVLEIVLTLTVSSGVLPIHSNIVAKIVPVMVMTAISAKNKSIKRPERRDF